MTPVYNSTYSFVNDFPALLESVPSPPESNDELFQMGAARGTCRVMCFHPKSNVTIALMKVNEVVEVIKQLVHSSLMFIHFFIIYVIMYPFIYCDEQDMLFLQTIKRSGKI